MNIISIIDNIVAHDLKITKGLNKKKEIKRLIYEVFKKCNYDKTRFLNLKEIQHYMQNKQFNYHYLKNILLKLRYPEVCSSGILDDKAVYLPDLKPPAEEKVYKFSGNFSPEKIYIEKSQQNNEIVKSVLKKFPHINPIILNKLKDAKKQTGEYIDVMGKNELFLVEENFDIFKPCPCTKNVVLCGYYILNIGFGCVYDCTYCYLQHYTNFPGIILPVNIEDMLDKLKGILKKHKKILRIGTGEFTDSLVLDDIIPYTKYLISFFKEQNHIFELKTKSTNINNILEIKSSPNIIISWSLNTPSRIKREEYYAPGLKERLESAKKVIEKGYKVGFHFDPIIYYDKWEEEYKETVEMMFEYAENRVEWISLGALRFNRTLKPIIEQRFPVQEILNGELLIDPIDKKMRYPEKIRIDMFQKMVKWIRRLDKDVIIYLCMEPRHIWQEVFNKCDYKLWN